MRPASSMVDRLVHIEATPNLQSNKIAIETSCLYTAITHKIMNTDLEAKRTMAEKNKLTLDEVHRYWKSPDDGSNAPEDYADDSNEKRRIRSEALVDMFSKHVPKSDEILEIGCNAGRNLKYLYNAGYHNLHAVEISEAAIDVMQKTAPEIFSEVDVSVSSIEEFTQLKPDASYDTIFTMAVLVHIHPDSDRVLREIARCAKKTIICVEMEGPHTSQRHFSRSYEDVFQELGFHQTEVVHPFPGIPKNYFGRVFQRQSI